MPIPGFTRTSCISWGRTTTTFACFCDLAGKLHDMTASTRKIRVRLATTAFSIGFESCGSSYRLLSFVSDRKQRKSPIPGQVGVCPFGRYRCYGKIGGAASLDERFDCALAKRWNFAIQRDDCCVRVRSENSKVCVSPDIRTSRNLSSQLSPLFAEFGAFWQENHAVICSPLIVDKPRFNRRQHIFAHHMGVGQKTEEAQLADPAKGDLVVLNAL